MSAVPVNTAAASKDIPAGFAPLPMGGEFVGVNGPLYLRHDGQGVRVGFRVESRHTNPLGICHGGMLATFFAQGVARADGTPAVRVSGIFKIGQEFRGEVPGG
jgi:hypothetical protein